MTCTLHFNDRGWSILTTSWTAGSQKGTDTDIRYTWGPDGAAWLNNAVSTARHRINLPFNVFAQYVQDCQKDGRIADVRQENVPNIIRHYSRTQSPQAARQ